MRSRVSLARSLGILWALIRLGWWLVEAIVALPLLPVYWLVRLLRGRPVAFVLPDDVVSRAEMDALKPAIAEENQSAFRLWWRSAVYHKLIEEHDAKPDDAYAAACEAADAVECTVRRVQHAS